MTTVIKKTKLKVIPYIGLASGLGGSHAGSGGGPLLIQSKLSDRRWEAMISCDLSSTDKLEQISKLNQEFAQASFKMANENSSLISIGGDHSCAVGTWSGVSEARHLLGEEMGLLWFDAHMDSHTVDTSESGNPHGMPLAALLGEGSSKLTHILSNRPKVKPENLFLIGIRSYETPERQLLERLGVRVYYAEEVKERGLKAILEEILSNFSTRNIRYGISMDIDFFDPSKMSATGTPEKGGPDPEEFLENCALFNENPPIAFEFVEFNPPLDQEGQSLQYVLQILQAMEPILA